MCIGDTIRMTSPNAFLVLRVFWAHTETQHRHLTSYDFPLVAGDCGRNAG